MFPYEVVEKHYDRYGSSRHSYNQQRLREHPAVAYDFQERSKDYYKGTYDEQYCRKSKIIHNLEMYL